MTDQKEIIEINGVKLEVDMRYARRIDQIRVGDAVKVLVKGYSTYDLSHGVVIGFEPFKKLPTIIVACMQVGYQETSLKIIYYNAESKDIEIVRAMDDDRQDLDKTRILDHFEKEITKKRMEIQDIEEKRRYFLDKFQAYWQPVECQQEAG